MLKSTEKISLREVAREAGVSIVTVSSALNGGGRVSAERRVQIQKIAHEMGYQPNAAARLLKTKQIEDLGLLIFESAELIRQNAGFTDITVQFMQECTRNHVHFQQEWFDCARNPERLPQLLTNGMVGGLLIAGAPSGAARRFIAETLQLPYVTLGEPGAYSVCYDNAEAIRQCIYYLYSLGHRHIGLINGDETITTFAKTKRIFHATLEEIGLNPAQALMLCTPAFGEFPLYIRAIVDRIEAKSPDRPTALFVNSGLAAKALICEMERRGISIPRDLSILCFETVDWEVASFCPSITAIEYNYENLVIEAIAMLQQLIAGKEITRKNVTITPNFSKRETVSIPPQHFH